MWFWILYSVVGLAVFALVTYQDALDDDDEYALVMVSRAAIAILWPLVVLVAILTMWKGKPE